MKEIGIYIHIPFCKQKCYYCDFISFANKEKIQEKYVQALIKEIKNQGKEDVLVTTIYIGGGTPSYINSNNITEILDTIKEKYNVDKNVEITIEVNPGTVNKEKLEEYKKAEINRLSIGLQSTNNNLLKQIGRIHTYEDFLDSYNLARKLEFNNINVDLMIALPNQKIEDIKDSLEKIIELNPEHISVYSLILEENTVLEKLVAEGKLVLPNEDEERKMYWYVKNKLELSEYKHYEISNFAKEKLESKHNLNCWEQKEYLGFGTAAHSYFNKKRYNNTENIETYIKNIEENNFERNININENQTPEEQMKEYMLLGLRKIDGVEISKFKEKFSYNPIFIFSGKLDYLVKNNLIIISENTIKLTAKGLDLANIVWEEFI